MLATYNTFISLLVKCRDLRLIGELDINDWEALLYLECII